MTGSIELRGLQYIVTTIALVGCAKAGDQPNPGTGSDAGTDANVADASCGEFCDQDADGVFDSMDECANTPANAPVNQVGCSDGQVMPVLEPTFPPYGLTWTPTGNLGRAGGLTWSYTGIQRMDLFHIYWIVCDDPATTCGVSLDGPIDTAAEHWQFSAVDSDMPMGKLVLTNTTGILLANNTTTPLSGRVTVRIVDGNNAALPFAAVGTLGVTPRSATHGAEIPGTAYTVTALAEVKEAAGAWTPYLDYYDAAPTPTTGGSTAVSFGASFYAE